MSTVFDFMRSIYAGLALIPFLTFIVIWFLIYLFLKDKKSSTRLSMDFTTLFLIGSVSALWNKVFQTSFGFWLIVLVLLIVYGLIGGYQTKEKGRTDLLKLSRMVWRLSFLGLSALYILLLFLLIGKQLIFTT